jgi:hypothetical protein
LPVSESAKVEQKQKASQNEHFTKTRTHTHQGIAHALLQACNGDAMEAAEARALLLPPRKPAAPL